MSRVIVDNLQGNENSSIIPIDELGYRVINKYSQDYTGGEWNPDNNYNWVPGQYYDYTPIRADSRIRVYCTFPHAARNDNHAISHWIFYANGTEQGRHSLSGEHLEDNLVYTWDVASWGTSEGRIGYQSRSYRNNNHEVRLYTTRYWNGSGSQQNAKGVFVIQEYLTDGL